MIICTIMIILIHLHGICEQETDILTDNLAKHLLNDSEVLFETRDHRTLANLQESMVGKHITCLLVMKNQGSTTATWRSFWKNRSSLLKL